jgi:dolichyl-phosphate beta-glucosyltransferase
MERHLSRQDGGYFGKKININIMWLSIIIPAYNEEKRIKNTLLKANDYLAGQSYDYEIIVVNDGSEDKTADIVNEVKSKIANLSLIDNKKNRGKGFAVRQGLLEAKGEYRLFLDADNSASIEEIEKFFPYIKEGYDIVMGSRDIKGANIISAQPWHRKFLGNLYRIMVKSFAGLSGFYDTQCGFKIFNAKSANNILSKCKINGWSFDVEILLFAKRLGYSVKEVPINWSDSPGTKVKIKGSVLAVFDLLKIRRNRG